MNVAVFGLGYVGTVTAACLACNGHEVWGVDPETMKVDMIDQGRSPVVEPRLDEMIRDAVRRGALHATTNPLVAVERSDLSLVCVGTPSSPHGSTDLSNLVRATKEIGQALLARGSSESGFHSVVVRSTVPPGTIQSIVQPALEAELNTPVGSTFGVAMCPEFLREGSGVADFFDPPFTVVGTEQPEVGEMLAALFSFIDRPLHVVPVRTAEGLKYACNAFHAVKVSFTNELARLYRTLGVDAREVMGLFCQDDRLNISPLYLRPGFAFGGSCLPKDLRSLLFLGRMNSVEMPLLDGALTSNELAVRDIVKRVMACEGKNVALLGLSFKTQTDDLRESPNVELAEVLVGKGFNVRIYDPVIQPSRLVGTNLQFIESRLPHLRRLLTSSAVQALEEADVAVVSSHDDEVVDALVLMAPPVVIDVTGRLGKGVESLAGYEGAGW